MLTSIKLVSLALIATLGFSVVVATPTFAACTTAANCAIDGTKEAGGDTDLSLSDIIKIIVDTLLFVLGAIAVVMIVLGGIRYTISQGDSAAITSAKNTILYAVVGLVVAIMAYAIVHFVIDRFIT